jgi:hypothetical protein
MNSHRRRSNHLSRHNFIEAVEPRLLLAVFAQDYNYQPSPQPPSLPAGAHATPISKGRFIVTTYTGGGEDDQVVTYTRVFADGSPDKTFGQPGSLVFDEDDIAVTFTGSRFIVVNDQYASVGIYTINGKLDESVGGGTGYADLPYKQLGSDWEIYQVHLENTYADGSMLFDVENTTLSLDDKANCQLLKVHPDVTIDTSFGTKGIVTLPTGKSGTLRDSTVDSDAIYLHVQLLAGTAKSRLTPSSPSLVKRRTARSSFSTIAPGNRRPCIVSIMTARRTNHSAARAVLR